MKTHASILVLLSALAAAAPAETRFMEAEHFDDLPYHGNWVSRENFYVKRHLHASGGAFAVTHRPGSSMLRGLDTPLPAGQYTLCLRLVNNRSRDTRNLLGLSLGTLGDDGAFKPAAQTQVVHDFIGAGYTWVRAAQPLTIAATCTHVRLDALTVENMGIGDEPEFPECMAIVDSVLLTDEDVEVIEDRRRHRNKLRFLTGEDPRGAVERIPYPRFTPAVHFENLPGSREPLLAKNLLRNSSFELSLKPHFSSSAPIRNGYNLEADCLDTNNPVHGRYCVRLDAKVWDVTQDYTDSKETLRYGNAFSAYTMGRYLAGSLDKKGAYVVSAYVRTGGKPVSFRLGTESFAAEHTEWRRYSAPLNVSHLDRDIFGFSTDVPDAVVWVDAMQIEPGEEPTPYQPLDGIEIGFQSHARCNIFYLADGVPLELSVSRTREREGGTFRVSYRVLDLQLREVCAGTFPAESRPGETVSQPVQIPLDRLGSYLLVYTVAGHPEQGYAIPLDVVRDPTTVPRNRMLMGLASSNEESMKIFHHAGFDWVAGLNDRLARARHMWPARDDFRFFDKYWDLWEDRYDIQYVLWMTPFVRVPRWAERAYGTEPAPTMGSGVYTLEDWETFWRKVAEHDQRRTTWMITDEASHHRSARETIPYIEAAVRILRRDATNTTIFNSSMPGQFLEMLQLRPDMDLGDAFGGSRHGYHRNRFFYDRRVKDETGMEFWPVAVGWASPTWWSMVNLETFEARQEDWQTKWCRKLLNVPESVFEEMAVGGARRYGFYTAKFDGGSDPYSLFAGDNRPKPFGIRFINIVNFLRRAEAGGTLLLDKAYGIKASYVYRAGKACVMLLPDGSYPRIRVRLDLPPDGIKAWDLDLNPVAFEADRLLAYGDCLFLEDNGVGESALLSAVREMDAYPVNRLRRVILPTEDGAELASYELKGGKSVRIHAAPLPETALQSPIDVQKLIPSHSWALMAPRTGAGTLTLDGKMEEAVWRNTPPGFIYCTPEHGGSYSARQGLRNLARILTLNDISATVRCAWDGETAHLFFDVLDDSVRKGDRLVVELDTDLLGDLHAPQADADDVVLTISPQDGTVLMEGVDATAWPGIVRRVSGGYVAEIALPLARLRVPANAQRSLGMYIRLEDVDSDAEHDDPAVLAWTTTDRPVNSPLGYGDLVLLNR